MEISQGKREKLLNEKRIYGKGDKNIKLLHENSKREITKKEKQLNGKDL